jgi:hypothetical protein
MYQGAERTDQAFSHAAPESSTAPAVDPASPVAVHSMQMPVWGKAAAVSGQRVSCPSQMPVIDSRMGGCPCAAAQALQKNSFKPRTHIQVCAAKY